METSDARATAAVRSHIHEQTPPPPAPAPHSIAAATSGSSSDRGKQPQHATEPLTDTPTSSDSVDLHLAAGAFLETTDAQLAIVLPIALDVCCTALQMHLRTQQVVDHLRSIVDVSDASTPTAAPIDPIASRSSSSSLLLVLGTQLVDSFSGFTIFFFLIELAVLIAAFRRRFFAHLGYVLDAGVVTLAIGYEIYAQSKALRLFGVLRVWRVFRLVSTLVEREKRAHDATKDALELEQLKALALETEQQAARASLEREYKSRDALEQLLQSYKDEVETLKEALQIAAEAVAEADLRGLMASSDSLNALASVREDSGEVAAYTAQQQTTAYADWSYEREQVKHTEDSEHAVETSDELTAAAASHHEHESGGDNEQAAPEEPRAAESTTTTEDDEFADAVDA